MRTFSILLILIIPLKDLAAQISYDCDCYDRLTNLSLFYEQKGEIEKAIEVFEKGMNYKEKIKWNPYEYFRLGELYAKDGNIIKSCSYLEEALKRGFDIEYLDYEEFDKIRSSQNWKSLITRIDSLKREYQKEINLEYRLAIEDIRGSDQTIRRLIKVPDSTFQMLDSINYSRLKRLIDKYGYPNMEHHGFDGNQGAYLVLLHASMYSEKTYQEILTILNGAIKEYGYKRSNLAQFIDRREVWYHKRRQIYGTWNSYGADVFEDIHGLEDIDENRFRYNLLRLKEQAMIEKRSIPDGYEEKLYPENYFCGHTFKE